MQQRDHLRGVGGQRSFWRWCQRARRWLEDNRAQKTRSLILLVIVWSLLWKMNGIEAKTKRFSFVFLRFSRWFFSVDLQGDIQATWGSIMNNLDMNNEMAPVNRLHPGHYNDPDMCVRTFLRLSIASACACVPS
jgi:hypothetical protein